MWGHSDDKRRDLRYQIPFPTMDGSRSAVIRWEERVPAIELPLTVGTATIEGVRPALQACADGHGPNARNQVRQVLWEFMRENEVGLVIETWEDNYFVAMLEEAFGGRR
jgi:hypothetical protein